jgi:hypothetical protein
VTAFDPKRHHIGLGESPDDLHGFIIEGSYRKSLQMVRTPTRFGGTTDYANLNADLARWTQDDFSGGGFQYQWGDDNKMFAYCTGMLPILDGKGVRTVPPIVLDSEKFDPSGIIYAFARGYALYLVRPTEVQRYDTYSKVWTSISFGDTATAACYDRSEEYLYVALSGSIFIVDLNTFASPAGGLKQSYAFPVGVTGLASLFAGKQYIGAVTDRNRIYTISLPVDRTLDATWTDITRVPGKVRQAIAFNGATYLLLADGFNETGIVSFDGANLLPITDFPYNFEGRCIIAYGGRIYVGGTGRDLAGQPGYPELYEVTGSSLRLIKTFTPERRDGGEVTPFQPVTSIDAMAVHEGLLFLSFGSYGLMAYDLTTDSLYGGPQYQTDNPGATPKAIISTNQTLNIFSASTIGGVTGMYRIASLGEDVGSYTGRLVTSDFAPEPALDKRWSEIHVVTRYGGCEIEYSTDGGETYTNLPVERSEDGGYQHHVCDLSTIPVGKRIRFRFSLQRSSKDTVCSELVAFTVGFLFLSSGKKVWTFSINGSEILQRVDGTNEVQDPGELAALLSEWADQRVALNFTDFGGRKARVNITSFSDFKPVVGPAVNDAGDREGFYAVTLTEV